LTACLPALYLLLSKRGVIDSSRGKWSDRMGESGGERQFPEQREPERVRARNVGPGLSRICHGFGRLRHDGFDIYGNDGERGVALEGTWPRSSSCYSLWESLSGLGLDQIFDIHGDGSGAPQCKTLERASDGSREDRKQQQAQTMLEAHEALCQAAPENFFRFKDVLDYLKQDLHHETPSK